MAEPQKPTLLNRIGGIVRNTFKFAEQSVAAVGGGIGGGLKGGMLGALKWRNVALAGAAAGAAALFSAPLIVIGGVALATGVTPGVLAGTRNAFKGAREAVAEVSKEYGEEPKQQHRAERQKELDKGKEAPSSELASSSNSIDNNTKYNDDKDEQKAAFTTASITLPVAKDTEARKTQHDLITNGITSPLLKGVFGTPMAVNNRVSIPVKDKEAFYDLVTKNPQLLCKEFGISESKTATYDPEKSANAFFDTQQKLGGYDSVKNDPMKKIATVNAAALAGGADKFTSSIDGLNGDKITFSVAVGLSGQGKQLLQDMGREAQSNYGSFKETSFDDRRAAAIQLAITKYSNGDIAKAKQLADKLASQANTNRQNGVKDRDVDTAANAAQIVFRELEQRNQPTIMAAPDNVQAKAPGIIAKAASLGANYGNTAQAVFQPQPSMGNGNAFAPDNYNSLNNPVQGGSVLSQPATSVQNGAQAFTGAVVPPVTAQAAPQSAASAGEQPLMVPSVDQLVMLSQAAGARET